MLAKGEEFIDNSDTLIERKIKSTQQKAEEANRTVRNIDIQKTI